MAYDPVATMNSLKSYLLQSGRVKHVQVGEPKAPPQARTTACVLMEHIGTPGSVLDAAVHLHEITIRLYRAADDDGTATETELAQVTSDILTAIEADATLGGASGVRGVDVAGEHSGGLDAEWGRVQIEETAYRVVEIAVPIIVDQPAGSLAQ